ncbi:MAG: hypothetical protein ACYSOZ_08910, partial [Planctomycetota bacterium]
MLKTIWKLIRTAVIVIGALLTFFAVLEILRAYQTLYTFHPVAGYIFLAVVLGLLVWLAVYVWGNLAVFPRPLRPPVIADFQNATEKQLNKYLKYLHRYILRLLTNPNLDQRKIESLSEILPQLQPPPAGREAKLKVIAEVEDNHIKPT